MRISVNQVYRSAVLGRIEEVDGNNHSKSKRYFFYDPENHEMLSVEQVMEVLRDAFRFGFPDVENLTQHRAVLDVAAETLKAYDPVRLDNYIEWVAKQIFIEGLDINGKWYDEMDRNHFTISYSGITHPFNENTIERFIVNFVPESVLMWFNSDDIAGYVRHMLRLARMEVVNGGNDE